MSFSFGSPTTTTASTFGAATSSPGFAFGSGDPSKPVFGAASTDSKPAFNFSSPTSNAGSFAFGSKTTAATSSLFGSTPPSTGAAFGAIKPTSFEGMMAPPNQTVGSPGFGLPATQNLSFGGLQQQQQQQAPPAFGTPTAQATSFGSPSSSGFAFNKPATTAAFSFATPASGFSAPQAAPNAIASITPQTSQPGFGTTTPSLGLGQTSAFGTKSAFSFGGGLTTAAPAFGTATTSAAPPPFGASPSGGFALPTQQTSLTQPQASTGLGTTTSTPLSFGGTAGPATSAFGTKSTFQTQSLPSFGSTALPTASVAPVQPTLSFGLSAAPTQPTAGLSFAAPASTQPSLSFGLPTSTNAPTQASTALNFAITSAQPALSFSSPATTIGLATTSSISQPAPLSFGAPIASTQATSLGFPATTSQATPHSFASTAASQPTTLNFGTSTAPSQTTKSLGFGTTAASTTQSAGIAFGTTSAPTTQTTGLFPATTSSALGFGLKPQASTVSTSATASSTPSGIIALGKSTAATTAPSLTTATTTTASVPPQMISTITFGQLEENINKWTLELEEQEKTFINQATQINAWDRLLIANGEKIVELNDEVQTVKNEQQSLEHELDFVLAQQKELEDLLTPMEKQLLEDTGDRMRDPEREHMYSLAENLDSQLRQMSEDLKEVIEHLNETNRSQDSNDPIVQIGRILNAHMSSMQWIDNSIGQITNKLDQLKTTHDTLRRDNERSFQLTYN